jgi:hypothetical protein
VVPEPGDPEVIFCVDEFGPLNLQPRPGRQWAAVSGKSKDPVRLPRPRMRDLYPHRGGAASAGRYDLGEDRLYGHVKPRKTRTRSLEFCRYIIWRNNHAYDEQLRRIVNRANVA